MNLLKLLAREQELEKRRIKFDPQTRKAIVERYICEAERALGKRQFVVVAECLQLAKDMLAKRCKCVDSSVDGVDVSTHSPLRQPDS